MNLGDNAVMATENLNWSAKRWPEFTPLHNSRPEQMKQNVWNRAKIYKMGTASFYRELHVLRDSETHVTYLDKSNSFLWDKFGLEVEGKFEFLLR